MLYETKTQFLVMFSRYEIVEGLGTKRATKSIVVF